MVVDGAFVENVVVMLMVGVVIPAGSLGIVCLVIWMKDHHVASAAIKNLAAFCVGVRRKMCGGVRRRHNVAH